MKHIKTAVMPLIGLLVLGSISQAKDRQGAQVVATMKSGAEIKGELIAVKKDFLVLSSREPAVVSDQSIKVEDIREVRVARPSKAGSGALIGLLAGAAFGAVGAAANNGSSSFHFPVVGMAATGGVLGLVVGAIAGAAAGGHTSFVLENRPQYITDSTLVRLSRYTRIPVVQ